ncbi:hypothetical protein [Pseudovibrio brasiliensis]|nr:hypothetical protein [Pseudovibrio brasiliensis]
MQDRGPVRGPLVSQRPPRMFVRGLGARAYVYQKLRPVEEQK